MFTPSPSTGSRAARPSCSPSADGSAVSRSAWVAGSPSIRARFLYRYVLVLGVLDLGEATREVCDAAIEVRGEDAWLRARRAEATFNLGRFDEAIVDLDWLLGRGDSGYPTSQLLLLRARSHAGRGAIDAARADLRALRTIEPGLQAAEQLERELADEAGRRAGG